jgi:hypothetical protein
MDTIAAVAEEKLGSNVDSFFITGASKVLVLSQILFN